MSEIHFDQDGEPNEPHASCTEIRWRYFPNPGTRGAPRIVHDKRNGGAPLYTPVDIAYVELRDLVDGVAGYYRGDQVDQARRLIPGVKPFYVSLAGAPRNAGGTSTADDLLRHFADANTRQSETLINQLAGVMREQRKMVKEARKIMRVVATADLRDLFKQYAATMIANDEGEKDDEEEIEDEGASEGVVKDIKDITNQVFSAFETWMLDRQAQRTEAAKALAPQAPPQTPPPSLDTLAAPPPQTPAPTVSAPAAAPSSAETSSTPATRPTPDTAPPTSVRNAAAPVPTPEQAQHLMAILSALQPAERTVARTVVHRMNAEQRAHWLGELSALTVDQAVEMVRSMIPARTKKESEP